MNESRTPLIIGNWKMHKTAAEARSFFADLARELGSAGMPADVEAGIAPPATALHAAAEGQTLGVRVYGQNVHWATHGAYTGELSAAMLTEAGAAGALIGHSERRQYFGETDATVNQRLKAALAADLQAVVCIGERLEDRKSNQTLDVIARQLDGALADLEAAAVARLVLAYEPVWAIGTGETATPDQAQEVHSFIRTHLALRFGAETLAAVRILYGGSVTPENVAILLAQPDVDGALVGGASLDAGKFAKLLHFR